MLKTTTLHLPGDPEPVVLTELPALVADRHARAVLAAAGMPTTGGIVALALEHLPRILADAAHAVELLEPFVRASRPVRRWSQVLTVQQAALALHVGFLVGRPQLQVPVRMQAENIKRAGADVSVSFCSAPIATVLHSGRASYTELETVLSTEDVFNIVELLNVEAIQEWHAYQSAENPR